MYTWDYIKKAALAKLDYDETYGNQEATLQSTINRFHIYANEVITQVCSSIKPKFTYAKFVVTKDNVKTPLKMPDDFVSFGDDVCFTIRNCHKVELFDDDFAYSGYNEVVFFNQGEYFISYNARWCVIAIDTPNEEVLDLPDDIADCIPSYIASQCYKTDDETKAQIFRNEYEMFIARIDDTNYKQTGSIRIKGDW